MYVAPKTVIKNVCKHTHSIYKGNLNFATRKTGLCALANEGGVGGWFASGAILGGDIAGGPSPWDAQHLPHTPRTFTRCTCPRTRAFAAHQAPHGQRTMPPGTHASHTPRCTLLTLLEQVASPMSL